MTETIIQGDSALDAPQNQANSGYSDYTAFGTFNPVYRNVFPFLLSQFPATEARVLYFVLSGHIMHANEIGVHWAGLAKIAETVCYSDGTVERAEKTLSDLGFIKMHFVKDPSSPKRLMPRYQVSPYVMWISHEYIEEAMKFWSDAIVFRRKSRQSNEVMKDLRHNQNQNQNQNQKKNQKKNQIGEPEQISNKASAQTQTRKRQDAPKNENEVPLANCKEPIPNQQDERLAQLIASKYATHAPQARQLVLSYGAAAVTRAIDDMLVEMQSGFVPNKPVGYLFSKLRKQAAPAPAQTPSGQYADFFER